MIDANQREIEAVDENRFLDAVIILNKMNKSSQECMKNNGLQYQYKIDR
jgi:hypothetical protein